MAAIERNGDGVALRLRTHEIVIIGMAIVGGLFAHGRWVMASQTEIVDRLADLSLSVREIATKAEHQEAGRVRLETAVDVLRAELAAVQVEQAKRTGNVYRVDALERRIEALEQDRNR